MIKPEKEEKNKSRKINKKAQEKRSSGLYHRWSASGSSGLSHPLPSCPTGCGGGGRGKLHHPLLHSAGCRSLPPPHREPQHLHPGRPVHHQRGRQAPEAGHLRATLLLLSRVQRPSLLSGWHPRCPEGKWLLPDLPFSPSHQRLAAHT